MDESSKNTINKFKGPSGQWLTRQLFWEAMTSENRENCLYTLKDYDRVLEDGSVLPSLRRLYLEAQDETEYFFAKEYFGSWQHWQKLLQAQWFLDYVTSFREELKILLAAKNLKTIRDKADSGDYQANKFLLERSLDKNSVGRPSKQAIKAEADRMLEERSEFQDDLERITEGLSFLTGTE